MKSPFFLRSLSAAVLSTLCALPLTASADVLFSEKFDADGPPEAKFEVVNPMGGSVEIAEGKLVFTELQDVDGWPHVFAPVNDDGGRPVVYSLTIGGGEGQTRLFSVYVRASSDRSRSYRVDFLIEGSHMTICANRFEINRGVASAPGASQRGAFPALIDGGKLEVWTENRDDGVHIRVTLDGSEIFEWVDTDADKITDGQYFGFALSDNGAKEQGMPGPFTLSLDEVKVSRAK
jgi:hypothetical protein